jgi:RNA-directed DNA polymerase
VKEIQLQINLPGVPKAKQGREVPQQWAWTEASVWTERMVATLERGIKGGKWYSLMDKVWKLENLQSAAQQVRKNNGAAGVDGLSCEGYFKAGRLRLERLQGKLKNGTYQPAPVKRVWIPKLGSKELRPLGVPTVEGRLVETAVRNVIEPIFEHTFAEHSYGFRPGRGAKDALRRVDQMLKAGKVWVVDADLKAYFDTIPQEKLMKLLEEQIADSAVLELIRKMLQQGVMETGKGWQPTEKGTPQGAVVSPLLANVYLNPLDHLMARQDKQMVRYADDFVVLCDHQQEAQEVLERLRQWTEAAGLMLHPIKTRIVDASQRGGFDFLGYHFERGHRWPRQKSLDKFREAIRQKTRRCDPRPLKQMVANVNRTLKGWFGYFQHSVKNVFPREDQWVRQRLRTVLRRRHKGRGRARGRDHQRWPNAYFVDLGLFSLAIARGQASHARLRAH